MRHFKFLLVVVALLVSALMGNSQIVNSSVEFDSLHHDTIVFSPNSASKYIENMLGKEKLWRAEGKDLRKWLQRLIDQYNEPIDSVENRFKRNPIGNIDMDEVELVLNDTLPIRWVDTISFFVDTIKLRQNPVYTKKTVLITRVDTATMHAADSLSTEQIRDYSLVEKRDTLVELLVDYEYLKLQNIQLYQKNDSVITPLIVHPVSKKAAYILKDSTGVVLPYSIMALIASNSSPFRILPSRTAPDSLKQAIHALVGYNQQRDSTLLHLSGIDGRRKSIWLTTGREDAFRYWVKNSKNDSITVWVGNPAKANISLALEEDVNVERMGELKVDDIPFTTTQPKRVLAKVSPLNEIPIYWNYGILSAYSLSGNYLSNWAKGGESSLSSLLDVDAKADYNNKASKVKWTNNVRLRYGFTWTDDEHGIKTNTNVLEANSQFNKVVRDKLDFSSVLYAKTQIANGFAYPKDLPKELQSRFLNPGTFTIGIGFEYKPAKKTAINLSPLSYRNTFVLDTITINQTLHGVEKGKRVRQEMGGQLVVKSSLTILKDLTIDNSIRLFSNYLSKPENVDVDWELGLEKQISWYFKIRLNFHVIYDDDIRFPILDKNDQPILLPDGSPKKAAQIQYNQFIGLTIALKI